MHIITYIGAIRSKMFFTKCTVFGNGKNTEHHNCFSMHSSLASSVITYMWKWSPEFFHVVNLKFYTYWTTTLSFLAFSRPWKPSFYSLFPWTWPLQMPQIRGITQYLFVCDWFTSLSTTSSRFVHAGVWDKISLYALFHVSRVSISLKWSFS